MKLIPLTMAVLGLAFFSGSLSHGATIEARMENDRIVLEATGLREVAGIDLDLRYDAGAFSATSADEGPLAEGSIMVPNLGEAGRVRVALIHARGISGSGVLATIRGTRLAADRPVLQSLAVEGADMQGDKIAISGAVIPELVPESSLQQDPSPAPEDASSADDSPSPVAQTRPYMVQTRLVSPSHPELKAPERGVAEGTAMPGKSGSVARPSSEGMGRTLPSSTTDPLLEDLSYEKGILDAFREYKGERSAAKLIALFRRGLTRVVPQQPQIAVADGKSTVTVTLPNVHRKITNYVIRGGRILSKRRSAAATTLEVLPYAGRHAVEIIVADGEKIVPFHLTVVPEVEVETTGDGQLEEEDVALFLERLAEKAIDLDGDGVPSAIDEFVYIGNYLQRLSDSAPVAESRPAIPKSHARAQPQ